MKNPFIISFFTVPRQGFYGNCCSFYLVFLGYFFLSQRDFLRLTWLLCGMSEDLNGHLHIQFLDDMKGKESKIIWKWSKQSLKSTFFSNFFWRIKSYTEKGFVSLVDFVDWLGSCWGSRFFVFPPFWLCLLAHVLYVLCTWCAISFIAFYIIFLLHLPKKIKQNTLSLVKL